MALTRVVQNAASARVHSKRNRTKKASSNAGMDMATAHSTAEMEAWKITASPAAMSIIIGSVISFEDTLSATSEWIGCTGLSSAKERATS